MIKWHNLHVKQCLVCAINNLLRTQRINNVGYRLSSNNRKNHYDTLEISQGATQKEIKDAYYELSKMHHPDKKKEDAYSAQKFREIAAAYEVLGNYRTRRLYDKGVGSFRTSSGNVETHEESEPIVEDDAQTKFYKQHMQRAKAPGHTNSSEFDEWTRAIVTKRFQAGQLQKRNIQRRKDDEVERDAVETVGSMALLPIIIILMVLIIVLLNNSMNESYDRSNSKNNKTTKRSV